MAAVFFPDIRDKEKIMRRNRLWILGAPDPEMELIEHLLRQCGEEIVYATDESGRRVHPGNAYRCPVPEAPEGSTVYAVECIGELPEGWVRIDHHRPGDPGYGRPPKEFLSASSIGQVIAELAIMRTWREESPGGGVYFPWEIPIARAGWRTLPGGSHHDHDSKWGIDEIGKYYEGYGEASGDPLVKEMVEEDGYYHVPSIGWVYVASRGGFELGVSVDAIVIPNHFVLCAAADHCLAAAYRGECPGVGPDALMHWRIETRATFQKRPSADILNDIERAREALRKAPRIDLGAGLPVCDMREAYTVRTVLVAPFTAGATVDSAGIGDATFVVFGPRAEGSWDEGGHHVVVKRGVAELPEAAAREGVAFLSLATDRDGRRKVVLGGHTTPETVRAFMAEWAPALRLVDVYGDPVRGFAGGYLPST